MNPWQQLLHWLFTQNAQHTQHTKQTPQPVVIDQRLWVTTHRLRPPVAVCSSWYAVPGLSCAESALCCLN